MIGGGSGNNKDSNSSAVLNGDPFGFFAKKKAEILSTKLQGNSIVISGIFEHHTRSELKKLIEKHGGKNAVSISKKTTFVLAGRDMGPSKKQKAYWFIRIVTQEYIVFCVNVAVNSWYPLWRMTELLSSQNKKKKEKCF